MEFKLNDYHRNVTDEELMKDILRVANSLGKGTISQSEYVNNGGRYGLTTIRRRFGSWIKAISLCGFSPSEQQINGTLGVRTQSYITPQELIDDLLVVSEKVGKKTFTSGEYNLNGKYHYGTYLKRFKTWNNALVAAGLIPFEVPSGKRVSEYSCLEEIERIWVMLGRQPTTTDIKNGISKYSLHTYERRFGSWRKALEFFVAYMNGEQEVEKPDDSDDIQLPVPISSQNPENSPLHKTKRDINLRLRFHVLKRDNFKCCACGASPAKNPDVELEVDHIIAWANGGETVLDNLQTLCSKCNNGKSNVL